MIKVQNHNPKANQDKRSYQEDYEFYTQQLERKAAKKHLKKVGMHKEHDKQSDRMMRAAFTF